MSACGALRYGQLMLQWANTTEAADAALARLRGFGVPVEVREAPGLAGRWRVMRALIAHTNPASLLDVGGSGPRRTVGQSFGRTGARTM